VQVIGATVRAGWGTKLSYRLTQSKAGTDGRCGRYLDPLEAAERLKAGRNANQEDRDARAMDVLQVGRTAPLSGLCPTQSIAGRGWAALGNTRKAVACDGRGLCMCVSSAGADERAVRRRGSAGAFRSFGWTRVPTRHRCTSAGRGRRR
jgi:hypothetical protein